MIKQLIQSFIISNINKIQSTKKCREFFVHQQTTLSFAYVIVPAQIIFVLECTTPYLFNDKIVKICEYEIALILKFANVFFPKKNILHQLKCPFVHNFSPFIGQSLPQLSYHSQLLSTYIWATSLIYLTLSHMSLAKLSIHITCIQWPTCLFLLGNMSLRMEGTENRLISEPVPIGSDRLRRTHM